MWYRSWRATPRSGLVLPSGAKVATTLAPLTAMGAPRDRRTARSHGVELRGLEPLTPTLPVWCATSCATAPYRPGLVRPSREQLYRAAEPEPRGGGDAPRHLATGVPPPSGRRDESSDEGSGEGSDEGSDEGSALFHLRDADVVAEGVAETEVD